MNGVRAVLQARRAASACMLALAVLVLLVQTLGFVHRVVHAPHGTFDPAARNIEASALPSGAAAGVHAHGAALQGSFANFLSHLFGDHASSVDCRVFDQLAHGDGLCSVPLVVLPPAFSPQVFQFLLGEALARWSALFDARGPPVSSLR